MAEKRRKRNVKAEKTTKKTTKKDKENVCSHLSLETQTRVFSKTPLSLSSPWTFPEYANEGARPMHACQ